ncbi:hypothetical protein FRC07_007802 [Ceratobasidium sp. 392]|nr:hypothetical protein FRC07_007802 [Ceratobasidium sp. 392]
MNSDTPLLTEGSLATQQGILACASDVHDESPGGSIVAFDTGLRNINWTHPAELPSFTKANPATETEPLMGETGPTGEVLGRVRVLGALEAQINGVSAAIPQKMLEKQEFAGLSLLGITASLSGPDGSPAACGWFGQNCFDWFWVRIDDIRSVVVRKDVRFRGGAICVWVTTPYAEYAVITAHPMFEDKWEETLRLLNAPRCDEWPRSGLCPPWWSVNAHPWPYERTVEERYGAAIADGSLAQMAQTLSLQPDPPRPVWRRLGPKGDPQMPDRPPHHLSQMTEWLMPTNAGMRKTRFADSKDGKGPRDRAGEDKAEGEDEGPDGTWDLRHRKGMGKRTMPRSADGWRLRFKTQRR